MYANIRSIVKKLLKPNYPPPKENGFMPDLWLCLHNFFYLKGKTG